MDQDIPSMKIWSNLDLQRRSGSWSYRNIVNDGNTPAEGCILIFPADREASSYVRHLGEVSLDCFGDVRCKLTGWYGLGLAFFLNLRRQCVDFCGKHTNDAITITNLNRILYKKPLTSISMSFKITWNTKAGTHRVHPSSNVDVELPLFFLRHLHLRHYFFSALPPHVCPLHLHVNFEN